MNTEKENQKEDLDHNTIDSRYLAEKRLGFMGVLSTVIEEDTKKKILESSKYSDEVLYGLAKGMSKEELKEFLTRYELEILYHYVKHGFKNITSADTLVEDVEEEKLVNVLGHLGIICHYNDKLAKWQVNLPMDDGMIIYHGDNKAIVMLRALMSRTKGIYVTTKNELKPLINHWMDVNKKEDPTTLSDEELDGLLKECGTTMEEIEEDFKVKQQEFYKLQEKLGADNVSVATDTIQ